MVQVLALVLGAAIGFIASRLLRRPAHSASAASVARNVGGALGARRGLSLPELQRATFSEMMRHVRVGSAGDTVVPVRYLVRLHPADAAVVEESPRFFTNGLAEALRAAATTHGWTMVGPVIVDIDADSSRRPGAPSVLAVPPGRPASAQPTPPPDAPSPPVAPVAPAATPTAATATVRSASRPVSGPQPMMLRRLDTDDRIPLTSDAVTIGRATDRDIVVNDNRVSRHHAVVAPHGSGWIVTDRRSSNGTRLNRTALEADRPATLRAGDSIEIGPVAFRFEVDERRAVARDSPPHDSTRTEATSVLDDATRERISGEYQWPQNDNAHPGPAGGRRP